MILSLAVFWYYSPSHPPLTYLNLSSLASTMLIQDQVRSCSVKSRTVVSTPDDCECVHICIAFPTRGFQEDSSTSGGRPRRSSCIGEYFADPPTPIIQITLTGQSHHFISAMPHGRIMIFPLEPHCCFLWAVGSTGVATCYCIERPATTLPYSCYEIEQADHYIT